MPGEIRDCAVEIVDAVLQLGAHAVSNLGRRVATPIGDGSNRHGLARDVHVLRVETVVPERRGSQDTELPRMEGTLDGVPDEILPGVVLVSVAQRGQPLQL